MKKTSNAIRFETHVQIREVMKKNPIMISIEATAAKAAKAMCNEEVGERHHPQEQQANRHRDRGRPRLQGRGQGLQTEFCTCERNHEHATHYGECGEDCSRRCPYDGEA